MTNDRTIHNLARLEGGLRTGSAHLQELEQELTVAIQRARHFGKTHGSPDGWQSDWDQKWDHVEGLMQRIRLLVMEMCSSTESTDRDRLQLALDTWATIQTEDVKLLEALGTIRSQMSGLSVAVRKDWNILASTLDAHLETIHSCGQGLRIKLELLKKHPKADVDRLVQDILTKLPRRSEAAGVEAEKLRQEYRQAAIELDREQHRFLGFVDVVKALLIWVETPEERVSKTRSLQVEES